VAPFIHCPSLRIQPIVSPGLPSFPGPHIANIERRDRVGTTVYRGFDDHVVIRVRCDWPPAALSAVPS